MDNLNLYDVLRVAPDATDEEIKKVCNSSNSICW